MVSISGAVYLVVYLCVGGLIFWLLQILINAIPAPDPFKKVANVVLLVLAILVVIGVLLSFIGGQPLFRP